MVAFGGAGGLFATEVADFLGIKTIISPPDPGNLCAFGLHVSDVTPRLHPHHGPPAVAGRRRRDHRGLARARERLGSPTSRREGIAEGRDRRPPRRRRPLFRRGPRGPGRHPAPNSSGARRDRHMWKDFHRVHDRTFGFHYRGQQDVELVNLRVQAVGVQHRPPLKRRRRPCATGRSRSRTRKVYWRRPAGSTCPLYRRAGARLGQRIDGPAIVEEYGSTVVVPASWTLQRRRIRAISSCQKTD